MPEYIQALIVILFLSTLVFAFARKPAHEIILNADYVRRRNLFLVITLAAFLGHSFWVYIVITGLLILFTRAKEPNPVALFFLLLFVVPAAGFDIPGMGLVNLLFNLTHQRLLVLVILLPAYITIVQRKKTLPFGQILPDKLIFFYLLLIIILSLRDTTFTHFFRFIFYQFIDIFLPYYVISRLLKDARDFRQALLCFVIAVMILALIGIFETARSWLLYIPLQHLWEIPSGINSYVLRAGIQRAVVTVAPIPLGYVIAVGIGIFIYLQQSIRSKFSRWAGMSLLVLGLLASLSRGPWVGAIIIIFVLISTGPNPMRSLVKYLIGGVVAIPLLTYLPGANKLVELLPYFGSKDQFNISYRERLIDNALIVIDRHPFLGSANYLDTPEMESMRQGSDIIDIVNTYIKIALESGYLGVSLFIGFFMTICWGVYRSFRRLPDKNRDEFLLGRALLATLIGILIIIFTVSSISIIPIVYWSFAGLGVAYINMMDRSRSTNYKSLS